MVEGIREFMLRWFEGEADCAQDRLALDDRYSVGTLHYAGNSNGAGKRVGCAVVSPVAA